MMPHQPCASHTAALPMRLRRGEGAPPMPRPRLIVLAVPRFQAAEDAHLARELVRLHNVRIIRVQAVLVMQNVCAVIRAAL